MSQPNTERERLETLKQQRDDIQTRMNNISDERTRLLQELEDLAGRRDRVYAEIEETRDAIRRLLREDEKYSARPGVRFRLNGAERLIIESPHNSPRLLIINVAEGCQSGEIRRGADVRDYPLGPSFREEIELL